MAIKPGIHKFPEKIGILNNCGIGDWLLLSPAIQEIKKRSPATKIYVLGADKNMRTLYRNEPQIDGYGILPDYSVFKNNFGYDDEIILANSFGFVRIAQCKQHMINFAFKMFNMDCRDVKPKIYLTQKDEKFGRSYAKFLNNRMIVLCNDTSEGIKKWDRKNWGRVIRACKQYMFVQVGLRTGEPIHGALNMLGRTTLTQAMSLVKHSKLVVTVDGLFNHVAHAFDIPKVILWGPTHPRNFGYNDNTTNIWKKIHCSPCMYLKSDGIEKCVRRSGLNGKAPLCMSAIEESEVINAIKRMLNEKYDPAIEYFRLESSRRNVCLDCEHDDICGIDLFKIKLGGLFALRMI